ncbi:Vitamin B12 transporter BtuB [bioreactor metagenome]|jgi:outer membrane receptor protein involved in Fe transport|uniref:Vitamin B12 transporter BtuB n=1 Tax=bioreactor metagenome TaxID=1076179 RepID=A0A644V7P5_9ZZZZ|nr:TonB-dependent receptor [Paludibacter sp.]
MKKIKFVIMLLCIGLYSYARETVKDSVQLEDVVVTGSKFETSRELIPLSVSQISADNIKQSGHYNVLSTLSAYVPGVFITERNILGFGVATGGSGSINIRGVSINNGVGNYPNTQVLVLIDGHPQYQGIFGHPLPDAYVASDVEKVEVIRGPASVLYGSNAMAGAVNIITKKQQTEGLSATVNAVYGSYNTQKYAGTFGFKKDKLSLFLSANHASTDGTRENTDFKISNGYLKAAYELSRHWKITADLSMAQYEANDNGKVSPPAPSPIPFHIDVLRGKAALSVENKYDKLDGAIKLYHNFGEHDLSDGFKSTDRNSGLMIYQNYRLFDQTHVTAGLDAKQYGGHAIDPKPMIPVDTTEIVYELAGYALIHQKLFEFVDLNAGLRFEHNSVFGNEWVPMVGAAARAGETTNFKASVSKGFRSPTVMELYLYAPNAALKPERMMNYELSWLQSYMANRLSTELTAFWVEGENMIQVVGGTPPKRQNTGTFSNRGIEFAAKYRITNQFNVQANYTFLDMEKKIVAAPKHQFNINLNYQYKMVNFNVAAQHVNTLYASLTPESIQQFTLFNTRISTKITKQLDVFLAGHNLLNQQYQINDGYPMPGINFHGGLNLKL